MAEFGGLDYPHISSLTPSTHRDVDRKWRRRKLYVNRFCLCPRGFLDDGWTCSLLHASAVAERCKSVF